MELAMEGYRKPHVPIFPFSAQGHVNSMLKLAQLLLISDLRVSFLSFESNSHHLSRNSDYARLIPYLQTRYISDGLPLDHPRTAECIAEVLESIVRKSGPQLRDLLLSFQQSEPVTCIIADGAMFSFTTDVTADLNIPIIAFHTISACAFWVSFCIHEMLDADVLPFDADRENLDVGIKNVPGMELYLRRRDLPSFCREMEREVLRVISGENRSAVRASALILNTFEELEGPILSHIRSHCRNIYTLGPFRSNLTVIDGKSCQDEHESCLAWLDAQPAKSVVYVSFGTYTLITYSQLMEFWHGLASSGYRFLWARRPDMVVEEDEVPPPEELVEVTRQRGCVVEWAPQEKVLGHPAVGGFLTHSGWNSTLESMVAGVPMLCWPFFGDQQVNSRFVDVVWRVGLDMKDQCDRKTVEKMVVELMEGEELHQSASRWSELAAVAVGRGGSSSSNLEKLVHDIRSMTLSCRQQNKIMR